MQGHILNSFSMDPTFEGISKFYLKAGRWYFFVHANVLFKNYYLRPRVGQLDFSKVNGAKENALFNWLTLTVTSASFRYVHVLLVTDLSNVISESDWTCPIQLSKFLSISLAQSLYNGPKDG